MPFSSLTDPVELACAQAALDAAWKVIKSMVPEDVRERERTRLAYIIAAFIAVAEDEDELVRRAINRYRNSNT